MVHNAHVGPSLDLLDMLEFKAGPLLTICIGRLNPRGKTRSMNNFSTYSHRSHHMRDERV